MSEERFAEFISVIEQDPAFASAEVVIAYGSRLHINAGYRPLSNSDLDIAYTCGSACGGTEQAFVLGVEAKINPFIALSKKLGFEVSHPVQIAKSLRELLENQVVVAKENLQFSRLTHEQEMQAWVRAQGKARSREEVKALYLQETGKSVPKDTLIVIRKSAHSDELVQMLRQRHYTNIVVLKPR